MTDQKKQHFETLDLMRGIAALCVMLFHWLSMQDSPWFGNAYLAVDFFFLLSGFVIAHSYEEKLCSGMPLKSFFLRRFVRLYPMILAGIALGLLYQIGKASLGLKGSYSLFKYFEFAGLNLLMLPTFHVGTVDDFLYPLDIVLWSLLFEICANVFYALTVRFSNRLYLIVVCCSFVTLGVWGWGGHSLNAGSTGYDFWMGFARVGFSYFLGVLIFRIRATRTIAAKFAVHPAALCAILIAFLFLPKSVGNPLLPLILMTAVFPVIIWLGANHEAPGFLSRISQILGDLSYPVYVLHVPVIWIFAGVLRRVNIYDVSLAVPLAIALILGVCTVSWLALKCYDEPLRRKLSRLYAPLQHNTKRFV
jgi:peptidoglycan/LPS O-acetylase OafA/YrhL